MVHTLSFKNLPFTPVDKQVIYFEEAHNSSLNMFITENYDWLMMLFRNRGLDFCYLPIRARQTIGYNAPYLSDDARLQQQATTPSLSHYLAEKNHNPLRPSLLFAIEMPIVDDEKNAVMFAVDIQTKWHVSTQTTFLRLADSISELNQSLTLKYRRAAQEQKDKYESTIRFSRRSNDDNIRGRFVLPTFKNRKRHTATSCSWEIRINKVYMRFYFAEYCLCLKFQARNLYIS